jgi:predicted permease
LASVLFGLAPALRATRVNLVSSLKQDFRTGNVAGSHLNLGKILVVTQVALSLLVLIGAGLFVRTLQNLRTLDAGFSRENILLFSMDPRESGYKGIRTANLYRQVLERLNALPGVRSSSTSLVTPIEGGAWSAWVSVQDYVARPDEDMMVYLNRVGPRFFGTLGMPLLLGRDFDSRDNENSPKVAVVNETMAHYFFGNENPIGRRFGWGDSKDRKDFEIVGVVKDAKYMNLREKTPRTAYVYCFQDTENLEWTNFAVRAAGTPNAILSQIRSEIQAMDKSLTISALRTLDEQINDSLRQERLVATLSSLFGLLALGLASIGLYGVMSYAVARRTNEIGIRMALGAQQRDVLWLVARETLWLVLIGLAIGLPAALVAARLISSRLFGLTPTDPLTITLATALLAVVARLAGYLPARRASRVDPMVALRCE